MKGKGFVNFLAYIAIAFVAVALFLSKVFYWALGSGSPVVTAMTLIAQIIAYSITAVFAFFYAKSRKSIGWMIAFIIFVIIIIVFMILNISIK